MSEFDYNQDYDQVYQEADYIARQNAQQALMAAGNAQVAEALLSNSMLVEQARQEQQAQFAMQQANEAEERLRSAIPGWPEVDQAEKNLILERAGRNNTGKPFSTVAFVDEVVAATAELQREMALAAENDKRLSDRAFQDELVKSHKDRSYSNRRASSWVHETLERDG